MGQVELCDRCHEVVTGDYVFEQCRFYHVPCLAAYERHADAHWWLRLARWMGR